jgi:hypothetical protein
MASSVVSGSSDTGTSTSSGCTDAFCAGQTNLDACGDFDDSMPLANGDWKPDITLTGPTTGTITRDGSDSVSCPSAARADMVGVTGEQSWVQLDHTFTLGTNEHINFAGMVKRTGTNGALDATSVIEVDFPEGSGASAVTCQLFVRPYDQSTPHAFIFLQTYSNSAGAIQLTNKTLPLTGPTAEKWTDVEVDSDWSAVPPIATIKVAGQSIDIGLTGACATRPVNVTGAWGMSYDDRTQTILFDNLTAHML